MDWYSDFDKLNHDFKIQTLLDTRFSKMKKNKIRILELGCGNSTLAHDLTKLGYKNITSLDFSSVVINRMKEKYYKDNINCIYFT